MQEQAPQFYFFGSVHLGRQTYESKGSDDGEVPTGSAVFPFPFSHLPFAQSGSHGECPLLPNHTHSLAEMKQEEKQQQKRGTSRMEGWMDEWMVSYGTGAFPTQATSVSVYPFIARYAWTQWNIFCFCGTCRSDSHILLQDDQVLFPPASASGSGLELPVIRQ